MSLRNRTMLIIGIVLMLLTLGAMMPLLGQGDTVITIALPPWVANAVTDDMMNGFEAQHPGVNVVIETSEDMFFGSPGFDLEEHFTNVENYVQSADILYVQGSPISPQATQAGYILDLTPLVEGNPDFNVSDFYPAMLEAFQWDNGTWAVPIAGDVSMFVYDRIAFDEAGLSYPNANWTFADLTNAAVALTQYDENGDPVISGFPFFDLQTLYTVFYPNAPTYDTTQFPAMPDLNRPELAEFLEQYLAVEEQITPEEGGFDFENVTLEINSLWRLGNNNFSNSEREQDWQAALLPGNRANLRVTGFAISAGTQYPELAFDLINFLSNDAAFVQRVFSNRPARQSLVGVEAESDFFIGNELPEEAEALIDEGLQNAFSASQARYFDFVFSAISGVRDGEITIAQALENAQQEAVDSVMMAQSRRNETQVLVATPVPTPIIGTDQIVLRFSVNSFSSEIPNQEQWDDYIADFIANNPRIGNVDLVTPDFGPDGMDLEEIDCYFTTNNQVEFDQFDTSTVLNLDPFMDADADFSPDDFLGDTLQQVQRVGMTYAYPLTIQPSIIWYDSEAFTEAGIPEPQGTWSIEAFVDALQQLQFADEDGDPPFNPQAFSGDHLLMLAAAFGGIPYDYSTEPPTVNLTDPASVNGLRQALDLARNGLMAYERLDQFGAGGGGFSFGGPDEPPVTTDTFSANSFRFRERSGGFYETWRITNFPSGAQYTPVAYNVSTAYITTNATDPQACYEFINGITLTPGLIDGIPVRRSVINDPNVAVTQGEDIANIYLGFADLLESQNAINFPGQFGGVTTPGAWFEPLWLNTVYNGYVLDDGDLETLMADAQANIMDYRECTAGAQEPDESIDTQEESRAYTRQFTDCIIAISPEFEESFGWIYDEE